MAGRGRAITFILAAALLSALALGGCESDPTPTPTATPTAAPAPTATPTQAPQPTPTSASETQEEIVARLRRNADTFEYAVGNHGGTVTYATIGEPLTFNLPLADDASSSGYLSYVFEGLTETSWLNDVIEPGLAESWGVSEDGKEWTFHLRQDVTWHDGEPFTAHDVDFTFNRIVYNDDIPTNDREGFIFVYTDEATGEQTEGRMTVTALDDYTVRFVLPVSFAPFLRSMGYSIYPKHVLEPYVDAGTFEEVWDVDTAPSEVIGTGPFTITSYTPGERLTLRRNPDYWMRDSAGNSLPYLDEIVYLIVETLEEELTLFQAGETDAHGVLGEEYPVLEPLQEEGDFTIYRRGPGFGTTFLTFNVNPGTDPEGHAVHAAGSAGVVRDPRVPPGGRAQRRQDASRRGDARRARLSAVVVHQPRHGRLPQPGRPALRVRPGRGERAARRPRLDGHGRRRRPRGRRGQPHRVHARDEPGQQRSRGRDAHRRGRDARASASTWTSRSSTSA